MGNTPIAVTDAEFQAKVLESDVPVLVDFWAPWCGPCRMVAPVLDELAAEYGDRLIIAKVNTDQSQQNASQLRVQGIPTMIIFSGGQEVDRAVGALPKAALKDRIDRVIA